ncbi:MAG: ABC transporter substrate-binding protein [Deltaproteobacteria bacterium]|nr:ABC transporter substrate-binding protein [Deltaproteobacteria bacterium]MDZ4344195.1 ABC transporter substrate-binding protein [Candidatus Binatia bacterium]
MKNRKLKTRLVLSLLFLFFCATRVGAAELREITLGLVSANWSTQLPIAVAQQAGFFKEEGVQVHSVTIASGGTLMVAILTSGHADLVISGVAAIMRAIARGAPVVVISGVQTKIDYALIGAKGLARLGDLRGKRVGVTSIGSFSEFAVIESLRRSGLIKDKDYTLLAAGGTVLRIGALKAGKVDAIPLSSSERVAVEAEGFPVLQEVGAVLSEIPSSVLVAAKKFAAKEPETVVRFIRALSKSMRLIKSDKEKAIQLAIAAKLKGNADTQRKALDYYADDLNVEIEKESIVALLKALEIKGDPNDFFDRSYLVRAAANR